MKKILPAIVAVLALFAVVLAPAAQASIPPGSSYRTAVDCKNIRVGVGYAFTSQLCVRIKYWDQSNALQRPDQIKVTWTSYGGNGTTTARMSLGNYDSGNMTLTNNVWKQLPSPLAVSRHDAIVSGKVDGPTIFDTNWGANLWLK